MIKSFFLLLNKSKPKFERSLDSLVHDFYRMKSQLKAWLVVSWTRFFVAKATLRPRPISFKPWEDLSKETLDPYELLLSTGFFHFWILFSD